MKLKFEPAWNTNKHRGDWCCPYAREKDLTDLPGADTFFLATQLRTWFLRWVFK